MLHEVKLTRVIMNTQGKLDAKTKQSLSDIANILRIDSIRSTEAAGSGHPTSCCSVAEIMSTLFFNVMRYKVDQPRDASNDRFVLSKGHAAPILYAAWAEAGLFPKEKLLNLRKMDDDLEGHPTPRLNFVDVATGSLGQGLSCAAGMAYTGKYFDKAEWNTYIVDGHDVEALCKAFYDASTVKGQPTCILAKTYKGKGCPGIEDLENLHGKPLGGQSDAALKAINDKVVNKGPHGLKPQRPSIQVPPNDISNIKLSEPPSYQIGQQLPIREAYGAAIVKIGKNNSHVVVLDADTKTSTFAHKFRETFPDRFIECFIAEQNLVGVGIGCGTRNRTVPFISTFAAFFTRAFDQIRMSAISQTNANFVGSHPGISIGVDGPSQMALEDLAMFRSIPGSTVFYPSDAVSCERAVELAANTSGVCFIRSSRPNIPVIYENSESFQIGKAKVVRKSDNDNVTVIGCGVTLVEAMKAADELAGNGINIRIIDPFTVKPIDAGTIITNAKATGGKILTVEDHYLWGGLGDAVCSAVSEQKNITVKKLAVQEVPRSGQCAELLQRYGISSCCIVKTVEQMLSHSRGCDQMQTIVQFSQLYTNKHYLFLITMTQKELSISKFNQHLLTYWDSILLQPDYKKIWHMCNLNKNTIDLKQNKIKNL
ncbi:hypothetical protein KUTeg_020348 [Tegillarca granosa]|uniref:transketolase n=1 Tax=Tegillarca granosa TaxID=220873 RepID=A0ABQ9EC04_TEGGR|nr:hypothetical protein KUTeg_020348 [Tegillarca granosa]